MDRDLLETIKPANRARENGSAGVVFLVVEQHALGGAFQVIELTAPRRPEKACQAEQSQPQSDRDEEDEAVQRAPRARRRELPTTMRELSDIATAAINGVTSPATASGTATTL